MKPQRYVPKKISDVRESDLRVAVTGKIASVGESGFVVEDQSGHLEVSSTYPVEPRRFVRVFCSLVGGKPKADAIQDLNGLDLNLYHKVQELYRKVGL